MSDEYPQGRKLKKPGGDNGRVRCSGKPRGGVGPGSVCGAHAEYVWYMAWSSIPGCSFFYYCETCWKTPGPDGMTPEQHASQPKEDITAGHFVSDKHAEGKGARRTNRRIGRIEVTVVETAPVEVFIEESGAVVEVNVEELQGALKLVDEVLATPPLRKAPPSRRSR